MEIIENIFQTSFLFSMLSFVFISIRKNDHNVTDCEKICSVIVALLSMGVFFITCLIMIWIN